MEALNPKEQKTFRRLNNKIQKFKRDKNRKIPYAPRKTQGDKNGCKN
jgi:hypothetical protein